MKQARLSSTWKMWNVYRLITEQYGEYKIRIFWLEEAFEEMCLLQLRSSWKDSPTISKEYLLCKHIELMRIGILCMKNRVMSITLNECERYMRREYHLYRKAWTTWPLLTWVVAIDDSDKFASIREIVYVPRVGVGASRKAVLIKKDCRQCIAWLNLFYFMVLLWLMKF